MSRLRLRICLIAMLAAASTGRMAAQESRDLDPLEAPAVPKYRVELILFAHADVDPAEEVFVDEYASRAQPTPPMREPFPGRETDAGAAEPGAAEPGTAPDPGPFDFIDPFGQLARGGDRRAPFQFRILRRDELQLGEAFTRIERLGAYRLLGAGGGGHGGPRR